MTEHIIVSLTSYGERLNNIPRVLDTIFSQTLPPDFVVMNLAYRETVPGHIMEYLKQHNIEITRVQDTKVYKKLIPTLKQYPNDIIINIDDDFLYPQGMIEDFLSIHKNHPSNPISGNREVFYKMQCHCGCASLTKAKFFGEYLTQIDERIIENCPSDDMVYTFFATKAGHPYLQTANEYFLNMPECRLQQKQGYSDTIGGDLGVRQTYKYLVNHFGRIDNTISSYIHDDDITKVIENIQNNTIWETESSIRSSHAYRLGKTLLKPLSWIKLMAHK